MGDPPDQNNQHTREGLDPDQSRGMGEAERAIRKGDEPGSGSQFPYLASSLNPPPEMANQDPAKKKGPMYISEEFDSNGGRGGGDRVLLQGGSSNSNGRGFMEFQTPNVVVLDLSKERAAMKTRWPAVGLFFSLQAFSSEGLFGELKDMWGLRGKMKYTQLKNNRYLLELEQE